MSNLENAGRCSRCQAFIIAEQLASHVCSIPVRGAETIWLDWIADGFNDINKDYVRMAQGLNGKLYSLILCKHNPPHNTNRKFTEDDTNREGDVTLRQVTSS
jgi:hypothetical protein